MKIDFFNLPFESYNIKNIGDFRVKFDGMDLKYGDLISVIF